ncbi:hypothetical protein [Flavobacterium sp. KJJ]|uniref:hypothetical protein n=1 Tax=Flavobacterium sp. KJJ TaxID=1270193 RepID=UPI0012FC8AA2|nr:hypothetical protein [Flavobacterium sp. KJJ]
MDILAKTINMFLTNSNLTNRIPPCNTPYYLPMQFTVDWYKEVSVDGRILTSYTYEKTTTKTELVLMSYPCDALPSEVSHAYTKAVINDHGAGGGISNFTNTILTDPSFANNPCLTAVFNKLGGSPTFQNYLKKFDSDFSVADLKLSVGVDASHPNVSAVTYQPDNGLIEIRFNPGKLNTPPLNIAKNFAHEILHAEMFEKLLKLSGKKEIPWSPEFIESIRNDEPKIVEYYTMYWYDIPIGGSISDPQHEYMAQLSINTIVSVLKEYDNTQSEDVYIAIAWWGLMGAGEPNLLTGLPPQPTVAWTNLPQTERVRLINIYNNFKNTNAPCQQ